MSEQVTLVIVASFEIDSEEVKATMYAMGNAVGPLRPTHMHVAIRESADAVLAVFKDS